MSEYNEEHSLCLEGLLTLRDDLRFLLSLLDSWEKKPPEGLDPTFYHTLTYEGDMEIWKKVEAIRAKVEGV